MHLSAALLRLGVAVSSVPLLSSATKAQLLHSLLRRASVRVCAFMEDVSHGRNKYSQREVSTTAGYLV